MAWCHHFGLGYLASYTWTATHAMNSGAPGQGPVQKWVAVHLAPCVVGEARESVQLEEPGEPSSLELRLVEGLLGGGQVLVLVPLFLVMVSPPFLQWAVLQVE